VWSVFEITPGVHTPNPSKSGARRPDGVLRVPQVLDRNRTPFGSLLPGVLCLLRPRLLQHDDDECDTAPNYTGAFHAQQINIFRFTAAILTVRCWRITRKVCSQQHTPRRLALLRQSVWLCGFQNMPCDGSNRYHARTQTCPTAGQLFFTVWTTCRQYALDRNNLHMQDSYRAVPGLPTPPCIH
jgi:hypothetical protein